MRSIFFIKFTSQLHYRLICLPQKSGIRALALMSTHKPWKAWIGLDVTTDSNRHWGWMRPIGTYMYVCTYTHWFRAVVVFSPYTVLCNRSVSDCTPSSLRRTSWTTSIAEFCVSSNPPMICSCAHLVRWFPLSLNAAKKSEQFAM